MKVPENKTGMASNPNAISYTYIPIAFSEESRFSLHSRKQICALFYTVEQMKFPVRYKPLNRVQ